MQEGVSKRLFQCSCKVGSERQGLASVGSSPGGSEAAPSRRVRKQHLAGPGWPSSSSGLLPGDHHGPLGGQLTGSDYSRILVLCSYFIKAVGALVAKCEGVTFNPETNGSNPPSIRRERDGQSPLMRSTVSEGHWRVNPELVSNQHQRAEGYVCDYTYYLSLHHGDGHAVLIHIPPLSLTLPVSQLGKALQALVLAILKEMSEAQAAVLAPENSATGTTGGPSLWRK
ncbi:PREDICTED: uncharacterized protein LOC102864160 [Elephantulus edwardii]|uniref:uncharacterized protein LOC102864160 n=1 Tax=Elephantulus edwardii TaxID=28737 RepID=UPI0003F0971C|nr:PREDICTED: uncharacterized protein LOC102864160 [Elephantulus edwardii]